MHRAGSHVKDEIVTVSEFDEEGGGGLLEPRHRHPAADANDAHLVGLQSLRAGATVAF
jgi:hypothetical protein